jgi:hypothetical protein
VAMNNFQSRSEEVAEPRRSISGAESRSLSG